MDANDYPRLIYLLILLIAIGGYFFASGRESLGKTAQQMAIWGLIFLGTIAAVGLWSDIQNDVAPRQATLTDGSIEIPRGFDGHYALTLEINGTPVPFIVDTGASQIVLTQGDAARVGLDPDTLSYSGQAFTANGPVRTAPVRLRSLTLGGITDRDVFAVVNEGQMDTSLLGMDYLNRWGRIEIEDGIMRLTR